MHEPDAASPSRDELEAAWCWDPDDRGPAAAGDDRLPATRAAPAGAVAREARPPDRDPAASCRVEGRPVRLVGSRIPLPYARETGANLLTPGALDAARTRTSFVERHQSFDHQRLWADLLSSEALAFNLFGDARRGPAAGRPGGPRPRTGRAGPRRPRCGSRTPPVGWTRRGSTASASSTRRSSSTVATGRGGSRGRRDLPRATRSASSRSPRTCGASTRSPGARARSRRRRSTRSAGGASSRSCGSSTSCCARCSSTSPGSGPGAGTSWSTRPATRT